jgi:hypothetical protein
MVLSVFNVKVEDDDSDLVLDEDVELVVVFLSHTRTLTYNLSLIREIKIEIQQPQNFEIYNFFYV